MEVWEKAEVYQITQELDRKSVASAKLVGGCRGSALLFSHGVGILSECMEL